MYREQRKSRIRHNRGLVQSTHPCPPPYRTISGDGQGVGVADQALNFPNTLDGQHVSTVVKLE